ncbi:hypothetical protein L1887_59852 [Cichorium endivia]|nr:hypothetical protein L1887_59852 [Cichorium endivia]
MQRWRDQTMVSKIVCSAIRVRGMLSRVMSGGSGGEKMRSARNDAFDSGAFHRSAAELLLCVAREISVIFPGRRAFQRDSPPKSHSLALSRQLGLAPAPSAPLATRRDIRQWRMYTPTEEEEESSDFIASRQRRRAGRRSRPKTEIENEKGGTRKEARREKRGTSLRPQGALVERQREEPERGRRHVESTQRHLDEAPLKCLSTTEPEPEHRFTTPRSREGEQRRRAT